MRIDLAEALFQAALVGGSGGGSVTVQPLSVSSNGTYSAPSGVAYSPVSVNVPGITPSGTISISVNGTVDVTNYASAFVDVPQTYDSKEDDFIQGTLSGTYVNNRVTVIAQYAFYGQSSLSAVDLPNATSQVGQYAFEGCFKMASANLPKVTNIANNVFGRCTSLVNLNISSVKSIGLSAFVNCGSLQSISVPLLQFADNYAFDGCRTLIGVDFPAYSATSIGAGTFRSCNALSYVNMGNANSINRISSYAFMGCSNLLSVPFSNISIIGTQTFESCGLERADFALLSSAANSAFRFCTNLSEVSLPMLSTVYLAMFSGCTSLTTVSLPSATVMQNQAFWNCTELQNAWIPNVATLGSSAFLSCSKLSTLTLSKCSSIYNETFKGCTRLLSLYLLSTSVCRIANNTFTSTPISDYTVDTSGVYGSVYVPASLYSAYLTTQYWSNMSARIVSM